MGGFEALFSAMRAACEPERQRYLATYFESSPRRDAARTAFVGLTAVAARRVAVRFAGEFRLRDLRELMASAVDEHRFVALEMLVRRYETADPAERGRIAAFYIRNLRHVDHWVLVDTSAPYILGDYLMKRPRAILFKLASSGNVARRRIAIVATWTFIKARDFRDTLRVAEVLVHDEHPLIQRAVGWMLREVSKRSRGTAAAFLREHARTMPRLMLRQARSG
jgi:3-methyladenine DNA glycosylase AlkD